MISKADLFGQAFLSPSSHESQARRRRPRSLNATAHDDGERAPGVEVDEVAIRRGENPYTKYYQQQGEQLPSDTQVRSP